MNELKKMQRQLQQNGFDERVVDYFTEKFSKHIDILKEYIMYVEHDKFPAEAIVESNYTAERLLIEHPYAFNDIIHVYSFLIYLRENRDDALEIIKLGFPIK